MGLLSKAATGVSKSDVISSLDEKSRGGLLKMIHRKNQQKAGKNVFPAQAEKSTFAPSSPLEKAVMENLSEGYSKFGSFKGVVIESLKYSGGDLTDRISSMVSGFGAARGLTPGRALILFSSGQDGDLIGMHLAKTVPGNNIFSFQANNPQEAFSLVKPFL